MVQIKTDDEMARLDEIFAQVEAELHPERAGLEVDHQLSEPSVPQSVTDELNRKAKEMRLMAQDHSQMVSNASQMLKMNAFKTRWERVLATKYIDLYNVILPQKEEKLGNINVELNVLRNFSRAVELHLERAERSAREQDNHHYYKVFAGIVKALLEKL